MSYTRVGVKVLLFDIKPIPTHPVMQITTLVWQLELKMNYIKAAPQNIFFRFAPVLMDMLILIDDFNIEQSLKGRLGFVWFIAFQCLECVLYFLVTLMELQFLSPFVIQEA